MILIVLPQFDFDPTEVAITYKLLRETGVDICFATPNGNPATADNITLTGKGLGLLRFVLKAKQDAILAYHDLTQTAAFVRPIPYADISARDFDGIIIPGGHGKHMKELLESSVIHSQISRFFLQRKPVGAIGHGILAVARTKSLETGKSVLYGKKTTALLKYQEYIAWIITTLWLKSHYKLYQSYVEDEVCSVLKNKNDFIRGPIPFFRDTRARRDKGFAVQDGTYVSARWLGDVYYFAVKYISVLHEYRNKFINREKMFDK